MANPKRRKLKKLKKLRAKVSEPAQEVVKEVVAELPPVVTKKVEPEPKKSIFKPKKGK
jgi:hypothetical protein